MQDCFRLHPDIYGAELEDDENEVEAELHAREAGDDKIPSGSSEKSSTTEASATIETTSSDTSSTATDLSEVQTPSNKDAEPKISA